MGPGARPPCQLGIRLAMGVRGGLVLDGRQPVAGESRGPRCWPANRGDITGPLGPAAAIGALDWMAVQRPAAARAAPRCSSWAAAGGGGASRAYLTPTGL